MLSGKIWGEGETLCDRDGCWSVACISRRCLSVWIEQKVNLSQSEYSSFHEHLNTSLWGNGPANHSLLHKNKLASSYIDPIVQACRLVFVPSPHRRTDWSRRYICTHLNYTSFGFTACAFWVSWCRTCSTSPARALSLRLSRRLGLARSSLAWSLWAPTELQNGTREEIRNMHSPLCLCLGK